MLSLCQETYLYTNSCLCLLTISINLLFIFKLCLSTCINCIFIIQSDILLIIVCVILHFYTYLTNFSTHCLTYLLFRCYICVFTNWFFTEINVFVIWRHDDNETNEWALTWHCELCVASTWSPSWPVTTASGVTHCQDTGCTIKVNT